MDADNSQESKISSEEKNYAAKNLGPNPDGNFQINKIVFQESQEYIPSI